MRIYLKLFIWLSLALSIGASASAGQSIGIEEKTKLQATMQQHIERNLVNGAYLQLDTTSGHVRALHPFKPHPVILRMGEYFVLCSDFRDSKGQTVNVDFYMARRGASYAVFDTTSDGDKLLKRLIKLGKVERVD